MPGFRTALFAGLAIAAAVSVPAQAGQFYKWVDDQGVTHYGEKAPDGARAAPVSIGDTTSSDADSEIKRLDEKRAAAADARKKEAEAAAGKPPVPASERERINQLCDQHRQNLNTLKSGGRVVTKDEKGNKRYLTDQEKADQAKFSEGEIQRCNDFNKAAGG
ncbi:MAG: DUF4124 domain-containing protein [Pseudomonadota bacterium]